MAKKQSNTATVVAVTDLQKSVVVNSQSQGFTYLPREQATVLAAQGDVMVNEAMIDAATGNIAVKPTDKLIALVGNVSDPFAGAAPVAAAAVTEVVKPKFVIETGVALPAIKRGGIKESVYPFNSMEVGQSFFIAASKEHPEPARTLASTVASATRRHAIPDPTGKLRKNKKGADVPATINTKVFTIRAVEGGARVWRTA